MERNLRAEGLWASLFTKILNHGGELEDDHRPLDSTNISIRATLLFISTKL